MAVVATRQGAPSGVRARNSDWRYGAAVAGVVLGLVIALVMVVALSTRASGATEPGLDGVARLARWFRDDGPRGLDGFPYPPGRPSLPGPHHASVGERP